MKVLLISTLVPSKHNIGGPSALIYYLAKERPAGIKIDLMYYQGPENRDHLFQGDLANVFSSTREVKRTPRLYSYFLKGIQKTNIVPNLRGLDLAYLPNKEDIKFINENEYDIIWIYPNMLYSWYKRLFRSRIVMTGPDCSYLHYQLIREYSRNDPSLFPKHLWQIKKYRELSENSFKLESLWAESNALLHVVGGDDKRTYDQLGQGKHSFFSPHPHSTYEEIRQPIDKVSGKLTILITGLNNSIYTGNFPEKLFDVLIANENLALRYRFLFIGRGFEPASEKMKRAGYEVELHPWVDNYEHAISKAHIQLFPIVLGTGTKGKVLCALATGLVCIGTKHAFENILIEPGTDSVLINNEQEIVNILNDICNGKAKYASMAKTASQKVRKLHSPAVTSKLFWDVVVNHWRNN